LRDFSCLVPQCHASPLFDKWNTDKAAHDWPRA
jgi:hypothetical protein